MKYWDGNGYELGQTATPSTWDRFITSISSSVEKLAPAYAAVKSAQASEKLTNVNIQRSAQGLPPLSAESMVPAAQVQVGLQSQTQKMIVWGAVGLGAVVLLSVLASKKR